jgi:hypothetical protein
VQEPQPLEIVAREDFEDRALFTRPAEMRYGKVRLDPRELQARLEEFLDSMREVINGIPARLGDFEVASVTLTAEISAKGSVNLLGTGGELAGKGGLTFTLHRQTAAERSDQTSPGADVDQG